MPWVLFRAHRTCCHCINQITVFQGLSGNLGNQPPHLGNAPLYTSTVLYLLKGQLLGLISELGHQFPDCRGCQCLISQDMENSKDPNVFPHSLIPQGLIRGHLPLCFPAVQATGLIPLEQPSCQCKTLMTRAHPPRCVNWLSGDRNL